MLIQDLGLIPYRDAWSLQEQIHAEVLAGGPERLLLLEHPAVITCGRRPNIAKNLLASESHLAQLGVELIQSDRGGDITFHGPGQLVAYPILRLADHTLSIGAYVCRLQKLVVASLAAPPLSIESQLDPPNVGVWVPMGNGQSAIGNLCKICSFGVRIRRGVTLHGLALNVSTDLSYFNLIVPCGLHRPVTSIQKILGPATPPMTAIKNLLAQHFLAAFSTKL